MTLEGIRTLKQPNALAQIGRSVLGAALTAKVRLTIVYGALIVLNVGTWLWAVATFRDQPALLGIALLVYGLGLRHAVDADHIAAIDNVTRKLMQLGQRPVAVGFFFAIGHSTVVTFVTATVAGASNALRHFEKFRDVGTLIGTGVSAIFLLTIAITNIVILFSICQNIGRLRSGLTYVEPDLNTLSEGGGLLARIFRPFFHLVTQSWQMLLLGALFGIGFDTATEVAMFSIMATQLAKGISLMTILAFPALFTAGMSLVDTTDGVMMLRAYDWALSKPTRKLYYNMAITLVSVAVALFVGGVEVLGLIARIPHPSNLFWAWIQSLDNDFSGLGFDIIAVFVALWALSFLIYRTKRFTSL